MDFLQSMKNTVSGSIDKAKNAAPNVSIKDAILSIKANTTSSAERISTAAKSICTEAQDSVISACESAASSVRTFDYHQLRDRDFYIQTFNKYRDLSAESINEYYRKTFEVDKSTIEMVEDVRKRLPVPAQTLDDIFEQCKSEAMRRAISSFALAGVLRDIDNHSAAKYANLSETYKEFKERSGNAMTDAPAFAEMADTRKDTPYVGTLENGYNKDSPLFPADADIEHVKAKKSYYEDTLIRIGTTDEEFYSAINNPDNLVFADASLNRSMQDKDILVYLAERGRHDPNNPDLIYVDIKQQDGSVKTVTVSQQDVKEAYDKAEEKMSEQRLAAAMEVGGTVIKTGAAMAVQQVVGLIVLETIDIFTDEIKNLAVNGRIFTKDGWIQNTKDCTARIQQRLTDRFEEREIWARAKSLGIEAGVAGALSVIPQILISTIIKMPAFVLALIRECTLSTVRCVRVLSSDDENKFNSIMIIIAGAASSIIGAYIGRVVSTAIAGVPLLNRFNAPITDIITGLIVTAVPLTAIFAFEQNKQRFVFSPRSLPGPVELPQSVAEQGA